MVRMVLSAFLIGIFVASLWNGALFAWLGAAASSALFAFLPLQRKVIVTSLTAFLIGIVLFSFADQPSSLEVYAGAPVVLQGYVDSDFRMTKAGGRFYYHVTAVDGESVRGRILISTEAWPEYAYGMPLEIWGVLDHPWEGDESFDYPAFLKKEGVRLVIEQPAIKGATIGMPFWRKAVVESKGFLFGIRDILSDGVQRSMSEPASAYINGILLGMRDDLPPDVTEAFSRTGTTHVLAISGYNIAIIAVFFMAFALRWTDRRRAVWWAVGGIAAFTVLTGASASVVRAAIMGSLILVAGAWGRSFDALTLVLGTAVVMTVVNPFVLRSDIGFQLSFAAVLGLIYLGPWFEGMVSKTSRFHGAWQLVSATLAANIATLPLILHYFGVFPVYALPANLLILPVIPFAMAFGTVAGLAGAFIPAISGLVGLPAWVLAQWQLSVVGIIGQLPGATVSIALPWVAMVGAYGMLVGAYHYGNRRSNHTAT